MSKQKILPVLLIILIAGTALPQQSRTSAAMRTAEYMERSGDLAGAIQIYSEILEKNSRNLQVYWRLKELYKRSEDLAGGIALIEKHLEAFPDDIQAGMDLGEFHYLLKNIVEAERVWLDLESRFGYSPVVYRQLFALYARLNEEEYLIGLVARGRDRMNNRSFMSYDLGNYYQIRQAIVPAVDEYLLYGSSKEGLESRVSSQLLQMAGTPEEAALVEKNLKANLETYPNLVMILLAELYFATKRYREAYDLYLTSGIDQVDQMNRLLEFAGNLRREKEFDIALDAYRRILDSDSPERTRQIAGAALLGLGQSYEDQVMERRNNETFMSFFDGNTIFTYQFPVERDTTSAVLQSAFMVYDSILAGLPATTFSSRANYRLGEIQFRLTQQFDAAQRSYHAALRSGPEPEIREEAGLRLGQVHLAKGEIDSAITRFREESRRNPRAQLYYVQAVFLQGDMNLAISIVDSILKQLSPDSPNFNDLIEMKDFLQTYHTSGSPDNRLLIHSFIAAERLVAMMKLEEAASILSFARLQVPQGTLNPWLIHREAELRHASGQVEAALQLAGELKGSYLSEMGWILAGMIQEQGMGDIQKAKREYTKFLETFPQSVYFEPVRRHLRTLNK